MFVQKFVNMNMGRGPTARGKIVRRLPCSWVSQSVWLHTYGRLSCGGWFIWILLWSVTCGLLSPVLVHVNRGNRPDRFWEGFKKWPAMLWDLGSLVRRVCPNAQVPSQRPSQRSIALLELQDLTRAFCSLSPTTNTHQDIEFGASYWSSDWCCDCELLKSQ